MQLYLGDCLEIMPSIPDKSIDMILCDLPYGTTACKWDVIIPFEPLWEQYKRIINDRGCIALFGNEPFSSYLRMSNIKQFKYDWIWNKNKPSGMLNAKIQPMRNHEVISIFYNKNSKYFPIKELRVDKTNRLKTELKTKDFGSNIYGDKKGTGKKIISKLRFPTTVKSFDLENFRIHPTQKPVALMEYLIKTYTNEGDLVLDNCMGSGTTGVACKNLNRDFIGIEKDPKYFEIAKNRIDNTKIEKIKVKTNFF